MGEIPFHFFRNEQSTSRENLRMFMGLFGLSDVVCFLLSSEQRSSNKGDRMSDKYILSMLLEGVRHYDFSILPPLPEYIVKKGAYLRDAGERVPHQVILLYEFEKSRFPEAIKKISTQLDVFRNLPGFTYSAHLLEKSGEAKNFSQLLDNFHHVSCANHTH
jgi:hypothetical protein